MTTKEKAIELYNGFNLKANSYIEGKKCAILCVDEIIKSNPCVLKNYEYENNLKYWQEVKQEIENL